MCEAGNEERENPTAIFGLRERDETENLVASRWERVSEKGRKRQTSTIADKRVRLKGRECEKE